MRFPPTRDPGDAATRERLAHVQPGMQVEDAAGERIGSVRYIQIGDPSAMESGGGGRPLGEGLALALGAHPEPNVAPEMVGRLLQIGYLKVDDQRRFRPDHHFYVTADEIVAVEEDTVRLGKLRDELITSSR